MATVSKPIGAKITICMTDCRDEDPIEYKSTLVDPVRIKDGFVVIHMLEGGGVKTISFNRDVVDAFTVTPIFE